ncbi:MAG: enoyl-CoA hydratase-related protein [Polyangiaceae bacterium]|nr:enoyl-CoA hydratase-related protein [Polyangiaceae bacterium]
MRTELKAARHGGICVATLARAKGLNALSVPLLDDLCALFAEVSDDATCRCVVLAGEGRAFLVGSDLRDSIAMDATAFAAYSAKARRVALALAATPVPVIAAVNGDAIGGGCELVLGCDFALAARSARFGLPEARLGVIPGMGGTYLLPRAVGPARAKELLFRGSRLSAHEARRYGLVNAVSPDGVVLDRALEAAEEVARLAPLAVRAIKRVVDVGRLEEHLELEWSQREALFRTADRTEGLTAFIEKRPPSFRGC